MRSLAVVTWALFAATSAAAETPPAYRAGVARIDVTPDYPVRLSGFGFRRTESEGVTQRIGAQALAVDDGTPAVILTVDNLGIPATITAELAKRLADVGVRPERLAVCATHTHTAPMLAGRNGFSR